MFIRAALWLFLMAAVASADWNPQAASAYLDARQKEWFAWPAANQSATPCVSCHTGAPYLFARRALRDAKQTAYEKGLLDSLRSRADKPTPKDLFPKAKEPGASRLASLESVWAALFLTLEDAGKPRLGVAAERALDRLWSLQLKDGPDRGAWSWLAVDLSPWEIKEGAFYGAALAAVAIANAPADYQRRDGIRDNIAALKTYLASAQGSQPLHNRLLYAWASTAMQDTAVKQLRRSIVDQIIAAQSEDGGWTLASLGPWPDHPDAPAARGTDAYATAITAFALEQIADARAASALNRALDWLRSHQDPATGAWLSFSMNKRYESGSMMERFMSDAATGYATAALAEADRLARP